jgi:peptidylprolyl isomerase/peptidyl-prolyl cis-trans isomerase C
MKTSSKGPIPVSHILVRHQYEAEDIVGLLRKGASFESLASKYSQCSSSKQGGNLGLVAPDRLDPDFADALLSLKPGEISKPIRTRFGYHLILWQKVES